VRVAFLATLFGAQGGGGRKRLPIVSFYFASGSVAILMFSEDAAELLMGLCAWHALRAY